MYLEFYGLRRAPFDLVPDPSFFFQSPFHLEALANLCYGVGSRKGVIVLTGEVGTGKTLLVRHLLNSLARLQVRSSHVVNPRFSTTEFLEYVLADFGVEGVFGNSKVQLLRRLNTFLLDTQRQGLTAVLVIDEAHLLDWELLEEVRLLTNLETADRKLLQIILAGQPELDDRLDLWNLRQLKQRIALRCQLEALNEAQSAAYVRLRLQRAGGDPKCEVFPDRTLSRIFLYSRGIPRLTNTLCENALISGCAQQIRTVPPEVIDEVAADFRLNTGLNEADLMVPLPKQQDLQAIASQNLRRRQ